MSNTSTDLCICELDRGPEKPLRGAPGHQGHDPGEREVFPPVGGRTARPRPRVVSLLFQPPPPPSFLAKTFYVAVVE